MTKIIAAFVFSIIAIGFKINSKSPKYNQYYWFYVRNGLDFTPTLYDKWGYSNTYGCGSGGLLTLFFCENGYTMEQIDFSEGIPEVLKTAGGINYVMPTVISKSLLPHY